MIPPPTYTDPTNICTPKYPRPTSIVAAIGAPTAAIELTIKRIDNPEPNFSISTTVAVMGAA